MKQRVAIQIYGVVLDVLLDIDLQRLADKLGAKAAESKGRKAKLAHGDIVASVSASDHAKVSAAVQARKLRIRELSHGQGCSNPACTYSTCRQARERRALELDPRN